MSQNPDNPNANGAPADAFAIEATRVQEQRVRRRNTILIIAAIALVIFGLTILIIWRWKKSKAESEAEVTPVVSVKVAKAEPGSIAAQIIAVGTIWPREKADVGAKISAQIKKMALLKNKVVRAGEVIAVLESRDLQAQRAEAVAGTGAAIPARHAMHGALPAHLLLLLAG